MPGALSCSWARPSQPSIRDQASREVTRRCCYGAVPHPGPKPCRRTGRPSYRSNGIALDQALQYMAQGRPSRPAGADRIGSRGRHPCSCSAGQLRGLTRALRSWPATGLRDGWGRTPVLVLERHLAQCGGSAESGEAEHGLTEGRPVVDNEGRREALVSIIMPCLKAPYIGPAFAACSGRTIRRPAGSPRCRRAERRQHAAVLDHLRREDPRIVVDNPDRLQAAGLNAAIRLSRKSSSNGRSRDMLPTTFDGASKSRWTGADSGGAPGAGSGTFQDAVCLALQSPSGWRIPHSGRYEGPVDTVSFGAFRRVFERVGLYDPMPSQTEDAGGSTSGSSIKERVFLSADISPVPERPGCTGRRYFDTGRDAPGLFSDTRDWARFVRPPLPGIRGAVALVVVPVLRPFAPWAFGSCPRSGGEIRCASAESRPRAVVALVPVMHSSTGSFAAGLAVCAATRLASGRVPRAPPGKP
jgi:hypothetical protein